MGATNRRAAATGAGAAGLPCGPGGPSAASAGSEEGGRGAGPPAAPEALDWGAQVQQLAAELQELEVRKGGWVLQSRLC